MIEMFNIEILW